MKVRKDGSLEISPVNETPESSFDHGAKSSIGTSAVQIVVASLPTSKGIIVKAANGNSNNIYVGNSDVTKLGDSDATDGFELAAGESITVPLDNVNKVYVISDGTGQVVSWAIA